MWLDEHKCKWLHRVFEKNQCHMTSFPRLVFCSLAVMEQQLMKRTWMISESLGKVPKSLLLLKGHGTIYYLTPHKGNTSSLFRHPLTDWSQFAPAHIDPVNLALRGYEGHFQMTPLLGLPFLRIWEALPGTAQIFRVSSFWLCELLPFFPNLSLFLFQSQSF